MVELYGALNRQSGLAGFVIDELVVEAQAKVDEYRGRRRNHDLVLRAHVRNGARAVVCVEAKAGEPLGNSVCAQRTQAAKEQAKNLRSKAPERIDALVERLLPTDLSTEVVDTLRYQLLTALACAITEAECATAAHAVLLVHEFRTDQRPRDIAAELDAQLRSFSEAAFRTTLPGSVDRPWCVHLGAARDAPAVELYLAHAVTDLRREVLSPD